MKIRIGFVANSSSCSYVYGLGIVKKHNIEKLKKKIEELEYGDNIDIVYLTKDKHPIKSYDLVENDNCIGIGRQEIELISAMVSKSQIEDGDAIACFYLDFGLESYDRIYDILDDDGNFRMHNYHRMSLDDAGTETRRIVKFFEKEKMIEYPDIQVRIYHD
jgi:hypothetical protein